MPRGDSYRFFYFPHAMALLVVVLMQVIEGS